MANTFKSIQVVVGATAATAYTAPAGTTAVVIGMRIGNKTTNSITVIASLVRGATETNVTGANTPIPVGSALEGVMGSKLVMQAADSLKIQGNVAACADLTLSVLEIT